MVVRGFVGSSVIGLGVIGTHDLVERLMTVAGQMRDHTWRLVGAAYTEESQAYDELLRIAPRIDVCLFGGPLAHDLARQRGALPVPSTHVPVSSAALHSALLRGVREGQCDPARVSVDSVAPSDLAEAYAEIGVDTTHVRVYEYRSPESAEHFSTFHQRAYADGETTYALTTVPAVADRLRAAGVPALTMRPTTATLRLALTTAGLLGTGAKQGEAQIAIALVQPARSARPVHAGPSNYLQQEQRLGLHAALLRAARRMDATVVPYDEHGFLVVTTVGALGKATDGFRVAPFLDDLRGAVGVGVEVGVGIGVTARDAEAKARKALAHSVASTSREAVAAVVATDGVVLSLPPRTTPPPSHPPGTVADGDDGDDDHAGGTPPATAAAEAGGTTPWGGAARAHQILGRLLSHLDDDTGEQLVVDADRVADALGVTLRTARRLLRVLADEGLAWPLPPVRSAKAGRPRQPYQLLVRRHD